jgi:hypothetical protein
MVSVWSTVLVVMHGLLAVGLLGAVTHQVLVLGRAVPATSGTFFARLRSVRAGSYTNFVVILYFLDFVLGCVIYATYRIEVRPYLEQIGLYVAAGSFETKEHLATLGLGLLPAYWLFWKAQSFAAYAQERKYITYLLAFFVWWNFLVGHILNNIRGLP